MRSARSFIITLAALAGLSTPYGMGSPIRNPWDFGAYDRAFNSGFRRSGRRKKVIRGSWQHRARLAVNGGPVRGKPFRAREVL